MSSDLMVVDDAVSQLLPMTLSLLVSLVFSVGVLFTLEWRLALAALLPLPLFVLGPALLGPRAGRASMKLQQDTAAVATAVQESLGAHAVVQAFGLSSYAARRFDERLDVLERSTVRARFLGSLMGASGEFGMSLIQLLVLGGGGYLVIQGELALGSLVAFQALIGNVAAPVFSLSDLGQMLQQATGGLRRVEEVLEQPLLIADRPDAPAMEPLTREVTFERVSFSYDGESPTLSGVEVRVPRGATVAVVGPSGAGKSTLVSLLLRFHDPTEGCVRFDGTDVRDVSLESLRARLGVVFQEPILFNLSVRENIELGRLGAGEDRIEAAARAAEIHDEILRLPQGYDTLVGERGGRLSGGQRQRLSLARALLRDPDLLLLDEPTSALDPGTEASVARTLERVAEGRTVVWVTHRLPTVQHADQIVVMQRGTVVECGHHEELLALGGLYRRLWDEQVSSRSTS
jgi:ATP-binding cassette subfamily B protein